MKQYTTTEQTAKLIELGFEKPKSSHRYWRGNELVINNNYSIGELIEILGVHLSSIYYIGMELWVVNAEELERRSEELIDALYDMILKLREEGVI